MTLQFKLPDIGEGVAEGEIVKWLVKEGERVNEHQPVVEVMTDKATVEIPSPAAGVFKKRLAAEGDVVPVGSVIFELETNAPARGESKPAAPAAPPRAEAPKSAAPPPATPRPQPKQEERKPAPAPAPAPVAAAAAPRKSGGAKLEFKLPDIGEGVAEGEVVKWLVAEGAEVKEHQAIVEVMTDKATVEIPSPAAGRVVKLAAQAGDVVPVGTVLFVLETAGAASAASAEKPAEVEVEEAAVAAGVTGAEGHATVPMAAAGAARAPARPSAPRMPEAPAEHANGKILAVPSARRVARDLGVNLSEVPGSGRNGVVRRADVEAFAKSREVPSEAAPSRAAAPAAAHAGATHERAPVSLAPQEREARTPFRGVRRKIAEAMVRSKFTAPHFTVVEELDVTELVKVREQAKAIAAESGVKLTYMPFIMKAVASGLAKYPQLNSKLDEAAQEIVTYSYVNLGIATDTQQGLIVPVVKDVQAKGLLQLAKELVDLADRTRAGKVQPDDLKGSTFSITNAGNIGGTLATPIINFPDVGILGVHRIVKRPGVVETPQGDKIEVRQYMNLSISVDHRIVDGATAVRFLVHVKRLLESPGLLAL